MGALVSCLTGSACLLAVTIGSARANNTCPGCGMLEGSRESSVFSAVSKRQLTNAGSVGAKGMYVLYKC